MAFQRSRDNGGKKGTGMLDSLRKKAGLLSPGGHSDEDEDSVFEMVEDAAGDACRFLRRSVSQAAQSLSEIGSRPHIQSRSHSHQETRRASSSTGRLDSKVSPSRRPGVVGRLSNVSAGALAVHTEESTFSSFRRNASSMISSIESYLVRDQTSASSDSDEDLAELAELARQYTDGQTNGNVQWTIRLAENPKKFIDHNIYRKLKFASSTTFTVKYNRSSGMLEVDFNGKEDFLESIKNHAGAHITLKLSLFPGKLLRKNRLQKNATRYMQNNTHFRGISAAELDEKTLSLAVVSREKLWKKTRTLWEQSVSLKGLSVTKVMEVYWRE